ncbi:hypothetical protein KKE06_01235 [Candidatus Micrarchaeota archaeon]|nr:hypothetical protein [Candidatus Micrarchaeota archaeon]
MRSANQWASLLLIFLLINTTIATSALAQETNGTTPPETGKLSPEPFRNPLTGEVYREPERPPEIPLLEQQQGLLDLQLPESVIVPQRTGFACNNTEMDPRERQKLWDTTLKEGFVGEELDSGAPGKQHRDSIDQNVLLLPDEKGELGIKQKLPNQKMDPAELDHLLNRYSSGAFAFGILLPDTLRAGRCEDVNDGCALLGQKLQLRNDGAGIIANYKNVFSDVWNLVKPEEENNSVQGLFKEELDTVKAELISSMDVNQLPLQTAERLKGKIIPNSILTEEFSSSLNSNCTSAACYIDTYSMFDKMFNAYSSGTLLATSFGPSLMNATRRAFGWSGRRIDIFNPKNSVLGRKIRSLYSMPDSWYTQWVQKRQNQLIRSKVLDFDNSLVSAQKVLEGGGFNAWWNPTFKKELAGLTDPVKRGDYYRYFTNMQQYARSNALARDLAEEEFLALTKGLSPADPKFILAKRQFATKTGKIWRDIDDFTGIDVPSWHLNHKSVNWQKYAVKTDNGAFVQPSVDSDFYDIMLKKMGDGHFDFSKGQGIAQFREAYTSRNGKLLLYEVRPQGQEVTKITRDTLEDAVARGNFGNMYARLDDEAFVPLQKNNLDYILKKTTGDVGVYRGGYAEAREFSVDDLADLMLGDRGAKPVKAFARNMDTIVASVRENGWQYRQHWGSLLDQYFAKHQNIVKTYLSPKGGLKLTAYPFAFWGFKRGFGQEAVSLYQLPDTWTSLDIYHGESDLFNNSFIDFFANAGSDQGDIFVAFLNKLPWKMILDELSQEYNPINELYQSITHNEMRSEVGNLAVYTSGSDDCEHCKISLQTKDLRTFSPFFFSPEELNSFILEDTPPKEQEIGQNLIAYTYRTNLKGDTRDMDTESGGVDLEDAIRNKETCQDAVKKMNASIPVFGRILPEGSSVGGALAFGEAIGYAVFTWTGFLGSAVQQVLLTPQLQDCVDTQEGYFVHFFAPAIEEEKKDAQTGGNLNTTKISEAIQEGSDRLLGAFQGGDPDGWSGQAAQEAQQQLDSLIQNAETKDLVEAVLTTEGLTSGQLSGTHLFYLWLQGGSELDMSSYKTTGIQNVRDGNTTVTSDFEKGQVLVNGEPVITDEDIARLPSTNTNIPAIEYPNTLTKVGLPSDENVVIFSMDIESHTFVMHPEVLDCIRQGVIAQTGVGMIGDDLTEVFGLTEAIVTDTHPNIFALAPTRRITAEGIPRKIAEGIESHVDIFSNTQTALITSVDGDNDVGRLKSIQFQNGVIIYKPSTNELIVWLKRNEKIILNQNEVDGLRATPTTSRNPITDCEEPAIDLEIKGDPTSEQALHKAEQFNQSLEHFGPFKIFDTPTRRFVFYSGPPPACEPRFKVIDKGTGEVLVDQAITSIEATPDGVRVTTADGQTHDLGFSAEGGKPILTYNGQPEPLLSAQGDKGAFWYDPEKGLWYTENAQLLPLLEAFRTRGLSTQVGPDGKVSTTATGNLLNLNIGGDGDGIFNLNSVPENPFALGLFVLSLLGVLMVIRTRIKPRRPEELVAPETV